MSIKQVGKKLLNKYEKSIKGGGGGKSECEENLISGTRDWKITTYLSNNIKSGLYKVGFSLSSIELVEQPKKQDKYCVESWERTFTINVGYIRFIQGNPFYDINNNITTDGFRYQVASSYINNIKFVSTRGSNQFGSMDNYSYAVATRLGNPIYALYHILRESGIPVVRFDNEYRYVSKSTGKVRRYYFDTYDKTIKYSEIQTQINNMNDVITTFNNYHCRNLIISRAISNEYLSAILNELSFIGRVSVFTTQNGKIVFKPTYLYDRTPNITITDLDYFLYKKGSINLNDRISTDIPYRYNLELISALNNFSKANISIDIYTLLDSNILQSYYEKINFSKVKTLSLPIAIDLPIYLKYGSYNEWKYFVNRYFGSYDNYYNFHSNTYSGANLELTISREWWFYVLSLLWEEFIKSLMLRTLKIDVIAGLLNINISDIVYINDQNYEYLNGKYEVISIEEKEKGVFSYTLVNIPDDLHLKPPIYLFEKNPYPIVFDKPIYTIW